MKTILFIAGFSLLLNAHGYSLSNDQDKKVKIDSIANDSVTYQLEVMDLGYDTYLLSQPPMSFYSEDYYKTWNKRYVIEWNIRYQTFGSSNLYESYIDYDPQTEYGLELEYKLYYYFLFFEQTNHVSLIRRKG